jgi:hypothetical protein
MKLPADYLTIVADGVAALRDIGGRVRSEAERRSDASELWLVVRDLEGLAYRIGAMDATLWEDGFLDLFITGQDFGVIDELLGVGVPLRQTIVVSPTPEEAAILTRLRAFLRSYCDRAFLTP